MEDEGEKLEEEKSERTTRRQERVERGRERGRERFDSEFKKRNGDDKIGTEQKIVIKVSTKNLTEL